MIWVVIFLLATGSAVLISRSLRAAGFSLFIAAVSGATIALASIALYTELGTPEAGPAGALQPQQIRPVPQRSAASAEGQAIAEIFQPSANAETQGREAPGPTPLPDLVDRPASPPAAAPPPNLEDAVKLLEDRLLQAGETSTGLVLLGRGYMSLGRFADAAEAYTRAHKMSPDDIAILAARIEAMIFAANGIIEAPAVALLNELAQLAPENPIGRFYHALGRAAKPNARKEWTNDTRGDAGDSVGNNAGSNAGNRDPALGALLTLYRDEAVPPRWRYRAGREVADLLLNPEQFSPDKPDPERPATEWSGPEGSTPERSNPEKSTYKQLDDQRTDDKEEKYKRVLAAYELPAALAYPHFAQAVSQIDPDLPATAAINAMVSSLAERLKTSESDLTGWLRLGHSYAVLGRYSESIAAYETALAQAGAVTPGAVDAEIAAHRGLARLYISLRDTEPEDTEPEDTGPEDTGPEGQASEERRPKEKGMRDPNDPHIALARSLEQSLARSLARSLAAILEYAPNDVFALYHAAHLAKETGDNDRLDLYHRQIRRLLAPGSADARFVEKALTPHR